MQPSLHSSCFSRTLVGYMRYLAHALLLTRMVIDIERMYGQRKLIAQRMPLLTPPPTTMTRPILPAISSLRPLPTSRYVESSTPTATEGDTTETETELETELDDAFMAPPLGGGGNPAGVAPPSVPEKMRFRSNSLTQHDLMNFFFRKDVIILRNVDLLRYAFQHTMSNERTILMSTLFASVVRQTSNCCSYSATSSHSASFSPSCAHPAPFSPSTSSTPSLGGSSTPLRSGSSSKHRATASFWYDIS